MGLFDGKGGGGLLDQVGEAGLGVMTMGASELLPQTSNFGAKGVNGALNGIKGGLSEMNPFHKIDTTAPPTLQAPQQVQGPGAAPTIGNVAAPTGAVVGTVAAPQGAQLQGVGAGSDNSFRTAQLNMINGPGGLQDVATGKDQTAQRMLQMQTQQNVANQFAMANSARPGQQAAAMRSAMNNASQMNAQANVQGAQLALQQRLQAAGTLGQVAGTGAGQDITVAGQNAGNVTQASIAGGQQGTERAISTAGNQTQASIAGGAQGTQRAIAQGQVAATTNGQNLQAGISNQGAGLTHDAQLQSQWAQVNGLNSQNEQARRQGIGNFVGGLAGAITGMPSLNLGGGGGGGGVPGGADSLMGSTGTDQAAMAGDGTMVAAHGGIVPTPQGIHIPYSLLLKRIVGGN